MSKEEQVKGTAYCLGVGPGDPELLSVKALRIIREADYLAAPLKKGKPGLAWQVIKGYLSPEEAERKFLAMDIPMSSDWDYVDKAYDQVALDLRKYLEAGKDIAILTIGDPTLYASAFALYSRLKESNCSVELVPGVSSITAVAAKAGWELASREQNVKIIPSVLKFEQLKEELEEEQYDSFVLMKAAKIIDPLREILDEYPGKYQAVVVANVGFPDEVIKDVAECEGGYSWPYFTTVLLKTLK